MVSGNVGGKTHLKIRTFHYDGRAFAHAPSKEHMYIDTHMYIYRYTTSADFQFRYSMFVFAVTPPESTGIGWVSDHKCWVSKLRIRLVNIRVLFRGVADICISTQRKYHFQRQNVIKITYNTKE